MTRAGLVEFLLVGGGTLVIVPSFWLLRHGIGLDSAELGVGFLAFYGAHLINDPHFTVTYLLFYKDAKQRAFGDVYDPLQRARYLISGFVVPFALAIWAVAAIHSGSARWLGFMIQLMFFLVGWHYVKQGFGVLSVLSARRGVGYTPVERRVVLAHCFAGWAFAWANPADPGKEVEEKGVVYATLAHGPGLERACFVIFALSAVLLAWVLVRNWRRERRIVPLAPLLALLITVWIWTIFTTIDPLMVYVIPALHSIQYLYFVWLLKRNEARASEGPPHFGRPASARLGLLAVSALALGWFAFHGAPWALDTTLVPKHAGDLGPTPYFAAIFTFVNIHHYFMDHVIWRRENPDTRFLRVDYSQLESHAGATDL